MSLVPSDVIAPVAPLPQAGPTPRPAAPREVPTSALGSDRIARPVAQPSPGEPSRVPLDSTAAMPVLCAVGLLAGGAVVAALPMLEAGSAAAETLSAARSALSKSGPYATTALRDFAAKYRESAAHVRDLKLSDPHVLGETLGSQAWTSTEEVVRSAITGAGLGTGAWAAQKVCSAIADAVKHRLHHATQ
jgi:hypothetical protein